MIFECQFHAAFLFYHQGELGLVGCLQVDRAGLCRLITETTPACHIQIFAGFCRFSVLVHSMVCFLPVYSVKPCFQSLIKGCSRPVLFFTFYKYF